MQLDKFLFWDLGNQTLLRILKTKSSVIPRKYSAHPVFRMEY